jgi:prepilin-type N-terminal cleavage/methylation domain-containing protein
MQGIKSGFSLIELLVVVAIIGILAAIGTVGYNKYTNNAKDAVTTANLAALTEAFNIEDAKSSICANTNKTWNGFIDAQSCGNQIINSANLKDGDQKTLNLSWNPDPSMSSTIAYQNCFNNDQFAFQLVATFTDGSQKAVPFSLKQIKDGSGC